MSNPNDYTVGWICAITTEYVAAQAVLDEKHKGPEMVSTNDNNTYTLGRMGKHNVVIAALPDGEYGISSAACVATDLSHSFPNVRFGLLVGIGGGAPTQKHDIRLGDVVVSSPGSSSSNGDSNGGVLQYDFGINLRGQSFRTTGFLNQPPTLLRTAITGLKATYALKGHKFEAAIGDVVKKYPRLKGKYRRPDPSSDRLYQSDVCHPMNEVSNCAESCGDSPSALISRPARCECEDDPMIHYGLIASADKPMEDAGLRDKLATEKKVKCFEMGAAGLMNRFPCLVIRGICDYSDSHKNKEWQGYAAMTAAMEHIQTEEEKQRRREEAKCHQLFRLTNSDRDATYEWYKNRVEKRVEGTCLWLLQHERFQTWLKQDSGPLLVSADPGCGKSVLARCLVDEVLPRSDTTVCYFFFKDQDQNTVRQALCALLHQLFAQKPRLIEHAIPEFRKNGPGLINSTDTLWNIVQTAVEDPQAGPVIMVLDAVDECAESEFVDLIRKVEGQFSSNQRGNLKYLLTCRPYEGIITEFYNLQSAFPNMHISAEEESEAIRQEINHVIQHRLNQLSRIKNLSPEITSYLRTKLQESVNRTYLWVYLIFEYLHKESFKKTLRGVESTLQTLPQSVNEAYERILDRSKDDPMVRKILSIVFAASRPLTLAEMNAAVNIDTSKGTIDPETDKDFKLRLRSWCGLFVSIYRDRAYFLHQTAREFLQQLPSIPATPGRWQHSINTHEAHAVLIEICHAYLIHLHATLRKGDRFTSPREAYQYLDGCALLRYSAQHGALHSRESRPQEATLRGSMPEPAIIALFTRLNALFTTLGGYCTSQWVVIDAFWIAVGIAELAVSLLPPDHLGQAAMFSSTNVSSDISEIAHHGSIVREFERPIMESSRLLDPSLNHSLLQVGHHGYLLGDKYSRTGSAGCLNKALSTIQKDITTPLGQAIFLANFRNGLGASFFTSPWKSKTTR